MTRPLTHAEAQARRDAIDVQHAHIALDLTGPDTFVSTSTTTFTAGAPGTFVECAGELIGVTLNGRPVDTSQHRDRRLPLTGLSATNELVVTARMAYSHDGEGLHEHIDGADGRRYLYAMSFLDAAPRWFACFDQPDLKARWSMSVLCPPEWTVLGNGVFTRTAPGVWEMEPTAPLSTYLVTVAAGPYVSRHRRHDGIDLGVHARRSMATELDRALPHLFDVTTRCLDSYHELFDLRLPCGTAYDQVFVPDLTPGAMENAGCVTLREEFLFRGSVTRAQLEGRAGTIAHELAHQWFGNLVTMRWWGDLWLNESFAEFLAHHVRKQHNERDPWVDFGITRKQWGMIADSGHSTHPVAASDTQDTAVALQNFDGISYAKGAAVLRELVEYMGQEAFVAGLRLYCRRHAHGNATLADLLAAWREVGVPDLGRWARAWLTTSGLDTLSVVDGAVRREPSVDGSTRPHRLTAVSLNGVGNVIGTQELTIESELTALDLPRGLHVPDSCDDAWALLRTNRPPQEWPPVTCIQDMRTRVTLWNSLRSQVRGAEVRAATAFDVVVANLPRETDGVLFGMLAQWAARELAGVLVPRAQRAARRGRLAGILRDVLDGETGGSDRQLEVFGVLISVSPDAGWLRGLLAGSGVPHGIHLDQDLRWAIVRHLMEIEPDRRVLSLESRRDPSSSGVLRRDVAWASMPARSVKERAFDAITEPGHLPASRVAAMAEGMFPVGQEDLTQEFARAWPARIATTQAWRGGWALSRIAASSLPLANATPELLADCAALARHEGLDPGLARTARDAVDLMRQALDQMAW